MKDLPFCGPSIRKPPRGVNEILGNEILGKYWGNAGNKIVWGILRKVFDPERSLHLINTLLQSRSYRICLKSPPEKGTVHLTVDGLSAGPIYMDDKIKNLLKELTKIDEVMLVLEKRGEFPDVAREKMMEKVLRKSIIS